MRILHVVPSYLPAWRYGGPIRSVHGLARAQVGTGHVVEVFTTDADGPGRLEVPDDRPVDRDGVAVHYFRRGTPARIYRSPAMARALAGRVREFDIVHLHAVFLWPTYAAARAARRAAVPYVVSPRGMLVDELIRRRGALRKRLWIRLFERRTLAEAAAIHLTSATETDEIERLGLALAPLVTVPNGIDIGEWISPAAEAASAPLPGPARERYALFLGRLSWKKGLGKLLDAVAAAPAVRLVVAGADDERLLPALEAQARGLGLGDRVIFLGEVSGADRVALVRGAVALALTSRSENFGNVVLEAMACGVPVVVTPGVGLAAEVERSACGQVVSFDAAAIAAALSTLWENPDAAHAMGARGMRRVAEGYDWRSIAARIDAVYRQAGAA